MNEEAIRYAMHQLALEGMPLTAEDEKYIRAVLSGEMTREQLIEKLKKKSAE